MELLCLSDQLVFSSLSRVRESHLSAAAALQRAYLKAAQALSFSPTASLALAFM